MSLEQAAKLAGVSRAALSRAIGSGKVSASRTDSGCWEIDPAEIHRVYPAASADDETAALLARAEVGLAAMRPQLELICAHLDGALDRKAA